MTDEVNLKYRSARGALLPDVLQAGTSLFLKSLLFGIFDSKLMICAQ